jgi:cAMP phosphodiesterase
MKIKFLGTHAAESSSTRLLTFVIDDLLAVEAGCLTSELSFEQQAGIKSILISHGHYDHVRSIPVFAFNNTTNVTKIYALPQTIVILKRTILDHEIYPDFSSADSFLGKAILDLIPISPSQPFSIGSYDITPVSVNHPVPAVGFQIAYQKGMKLFYTGDTGAGLSEAWKAVSPGLLIIDVSFPNDMRGVAIESGHLCPGLLKEELLEFRRIKGYFPETIAIHLTPKYEDIIRSELKDISNELGINIGIAQEGDEKVI